MMKIENAKIESFSLDCERGFISFEMRFSYETGNQGLGGYCTYNPNISTNDFTGKVLFNLMKVLDITDIKDIKGYCRVEREDDSFHAKVIKIGHIVDNRWLDLRNEFEVVEL